MNVSSLEYSVSLEMGKVVSTGPGLGPKCFFLVPAPKFFPERDRDQKRLVPLMSKYLTSTFQPTRRLVTGIHGQRDGKQEFRRKDFGSRLLAAEGEGGEDRCG
jgi:hypothetical protein